MLKSAGFTFIAKLMVALLNFAAIVMLSRYLGPADRGICSWYLVIISVCLVFSETIAGPTAGFLLLRYPGKWIRFASYAWAVITSVVITGLFFAFQRISINEWVLLIILCWLNAGNSIHLHLLLANQQFKLFNSLAVFTSATLVICLLLFFSSGFLSKMGYLYSLLLSWGLSFLIGMILLSKPYGSKVEKLSLRFFIKDGFRYGITNQASHLTGLLNNRLIFFVLPANMLGVYSNALALAEATMMIPGSMGQVLYAAVLNEKNAGNSKRLAVLSWWLTFLFLAGLFLLVLVLPDTLYQAVFGKSFIGVKAYLVFLSGAIVFYGCYLVFSYWQSANGRFIYNFYAMLGGLLVNTLVSLIVYFNGLYHITSGILALAAGFITIFMISLVQFSKHKEGLKKLFRLPGQADFKQFFNN